MFTCPSDYSPTRSLLCHRVLVHLPVQPKRPLILNPRPLLRLLWNVLTYLNHRLLAAPDYLALNSIPGTGNIYIPS
jgi:hypothetical protein